MSLDSIEHELLSTLRSVEHEMRGVKQVQQEQSDAIVSLTQRMQASINSLSVWVSDVQVAQRATTTRALRPLWALVIVAAVAVVLVFGLGVGALFQQQARIEQERRGVPVIAITATPAQPWDP